MNGLIKIVVLISLFASQCNDRTIVKYGLNDFPGKNPKAVIGSFRGTYKRILNYKKGYTFWEDEEGPIYFIFIDTTYSYWGTLPGCPPRGKGKCVIGEDKITFIDTSSSNDNYKLNGDFELIFHNNTIILRQQDYKNDILHNAWLEKLR